MIHDVLIAGAGPVGLLLACELRLGGASVLVLEKALDPASPFKVPPFGVRGLSIPTCETLDRRNLLDAIAGPTPPRAGGHFAGIAFDADLVDAGRWPWRLPGPAFLPAGATMAQIEAALTRRALDLGAQIHRGAAVEQLDLSRNTVRVIAGGEAYAASWLVGCDGGRSVVRKAAGFSFVGTEPEFTGYSIQADIMGLDALPLGRHYTANGMYFHSKPGVVALVAFDGGAGHRAAMNADDVQAVLRTVTGAPVVVTALHQAATWTDRAFQVETYRRDHVLLAGDAAHIHAPLGGQGLNLGIGDAMNLGWKLAATIRGAAPDGLLDSYNEERRPVGAGVLDWSRAQATLMRPSPSSRALEAVMRDVIGTRDGATYFAGRVWGIGRQYDMGAHSLLGMSAPNFEFADGTTLGECLRAGKWVLVDFDGSVPLQSVGARWTDRMMYIRSDATDRLGLSAVMVRPDGIVAWVAGGALTSPDLAQVEARWLGAPGSDA